MLYKEIAATGTTVLKTGPGYLQGVTVNNPGTGPGTIQIFDNGAASGTAIAGATAFALPAAGSFLDYDCGFTNGLTVVVGGTFTNGTITVEYY